MAAVQKQFDVPGIGVAIVRNGAVALERGYGVREVGKPEPVSAHTMFAIASNTEAFTAASLNMLQVDGRLAELLRAPHRVANWGLARAGVTPDAAAE